MEPTTTFDLVHLLGDVLPTAGVGGILAVVIFYFYRQDSERNMKKFEEITVRQEKATDGWKSIVQENTAALTRLTERIK